MVHLLIGLTKLEKGMRDMSEDEVKYKRLDYLKDLVTNIVDVNQKLDDMPDFESDESAAKRQQKGKGLRIMTLKQMIIRLSILSAQLKAGHNSQKLKNQIKQIVYSLYRSKNVSKTIYNNLINTI